MALHFAHMRSSSKRIKGSSLWPCFTTFACIGRISLAVLHFCSSDIMCLRATSGESSKLEFESAKGSKPNGLYQSLHLLFSLVWFAGGEGTVTSLYLVWERWRGKFFFTIFNLLLS